MGAVTRHPDIIATDLEDEVVLLNPRTQTMFTLNATGRVVWYGLESFSLDELAGQLEERFEVTREAANADIEALLEALRSAGLVHD